MKNIQGRSIWILGASSGIGRALAEQLADADNFVIVSARSEVALREIAIKFPGKVKILPADFSENLDIDKCKHELSEITDYLDMVIYSAGVCDYEDNLKFDLNIYTRAIDINFLGAIRCLKIALPFFKKSLQENSSHRPHFAVVSSLSTHLGFPRAEAYGASKAALNYFMESLRTDLSNLPIDLSLIKPGFVATSLVNNNDFSMPLMMSPEAAGKRIIDQLSHRKFNINFPTRLSLTLRVVALIPWWGFKFLARKATRIQSWK